MSAPLSKTEPVGALAQRLNVYNTLLDERLSGILDGRPAAERLYRMMSYHLGARYRDGNRRSFAGGKRLRPTLCSLSCECVGGTPADAAPGALAIELVHNFSLAHDDIQDHSETRRGRPAVWRRWGVPQAINVGDGLFSLAQLAVHQVSTDPEVISRASYLLNSVCLRLCEGQFLDLELSTPIPPSPDRYRTMIRAKSAEIFGGAAELGALLGLGTEDLKARLGRFGRLLGEAFQMRDDVLGVWGPQSHTGKPAEDIRFKKLGLPLVVAWENASPLARSRLCRIYHQAAPLGDAEVAEVLDIFAGCQAQERAELATKRRFTSAISTLDTLEGHADAVDLFRELVGWLSN